MTSNSTKSPLRKRFDISKPYDGPPFIAPWGDGKEEVTGEGLYETVERYDDELTARVRVAVLNQGRGKKGKYLLHECVDPENDEWIEVDDEEAA